jgi:hypothetical protein
VLEHRSEHVHAIGMISILNANLEEALGELLARVLHIRVEVGKAIYLTPKSAFARLEILEAAAKARLRPKEEGDTFNENEEGKAATLQRVLQVVPRARGVIGRLHKVMHDAWGIETGTTIVARVSLPLAQKNAAVPAPIKTFFDLIRDIQGVINDATLLA